MSASDLEMWRQGVVDGIVRRLDGDGVRVEDEDWDCDAEDADGDKLPPGQLFLTAHQGIGRRVTVLLQVTVIEGTIT